jgi:hypothetical protein
MSRHDSCAWRTVSSEPGPQLIDPLRILLQCVDYALALAEVCKRSKTLPAAISGDFIGPQTWDPYWTNVDPYIVIDTHIYFFVGGSYSYDAAYSACYLAKSYQNASNPTFIGEWSIQATVSVTDLLNMTTTGNFARILLPYRCCSTRPTYESFTDLTRRVSTTSAITLVVTSTAVSCRHTPSTLAVVCSGTASTMAIPLSVMMARLKSTTGPGKFLLLRASCPVPVTSLRLYVRQKK